MHSIDSIPSWRSGVTVSLCSLGLVAALGCGPGGEAPPPEQAPQAAPAAEPGGRARVYFAEPQDGATVKSPARFRFGIENYELAPVPQGTVEVVRQGVGHHHLGVDTDCLPVGEVIPQAAPWIHFGGGQTEIDMQLEPGPHTFVLQLGDDQHRTVEGMCETINITVAQ